MKELAEYRINLMKRLETAAHEFREECMKVKDPNVALEADGWRLHQLAVHTVSDRHDLKQALARHHNVGSANIVTGEGIDGLLNLAARMFAAEGAPVITSLGAYPTFNFHVAGFGGRLVTVPYSDDRESLDGLLEAARRLAAPMVYLSKTHNPKGTRW